MFRSHPGESLQAESSAKRMRHTIDRLHSGVFCSWRRSLKTNGSHVVDAQGLNEFTSSIRRTFRDHRRGPPECANHQFAAATQLMRVGRLSDAQSCLIRLVPPIAAAIVLPIAFDALRRGSLSRWAYLCVVRASECPNSFPIIGRLKPHSPRSSHRCAGDRAAGPLQGP